MKIFDTLFKIENNVFPIRRINFKSLSLIKLSLAIAFASMPSIAMGINDVRITVGDFQVQSDNPQYKYIGKGFAEFISIDIAKASNVDLIDREKRIEAIKELELSMTGLVDETSQIAIGKILAAKYIISGNIFDMAGGISVTFKVIDAATGKIILQDKVAGKLTNYEYISASISQKILTNFAIKVPEAVLAKSKTPLEKLENTAVRFSNAMEAYDKNDLSLARKELQKAKDLDPDNDAVNIYLKKLVINTAKFKTITEGCYPNQNPAYLSIIKYDKLYVSGAFINLQRSETTLESDSNYAVAEQDVRANIGYQFPIGDKMGMSVEAIVFHYEDELTKKGSPTTALSNSQSFGGLISLGYAINNYLSLGGGVSFFIQNRHQSSGDIEHDQNKKNAAASFGLLLKNMDGTLIFDTLAGYSSQKTILLDPATFSTGKEVKEPVYNENTFTFGLFDKRLFLVLKEVNNFYTDRDYYVGRVIPAIEYWFVNWFSLRGGLEGSYVDMEGEKETGLGWTVGSSIRSISLGIDFDINYTNRKRPSRVVAGQAIDESILYFALSKSNISFSR